MVMRDKNLKSSNIISLKISIHYFFLYKSSEVHFLVALGYVEKSVTLVQKCIRNKIQFLLLQTLRVCRPYALQIPLKLTEAMYKVKLVCNSHGILVSEPAR